MKVEKWKQDTYTLILCIESKSGCAELCKPLGICYDSHYAVVGLAGPRSILQCANNQMSARIIKNYV